MKRPYLFIPVIFAIASCQKRNNLDSKGELPGLLNVKVVNNHLLFSSVEEYNRLFTLSPEDKGQIFSDLERKNDFVSMKKKWADNTEAAGNNKSLRIFGGCDVPDSLIEDNKDFFSTLDSNGIIQIDSTVYRYDYCTGGAWVISSADAANSTNYNDFLGGRQRANIVGFFPSYVDVTEAVVEGYKTMPDTNTVQGNETFERGSGLFSTTTNENMYINNNPKSPKEVQDFDGKLSYDKFAFYFHFYGKEKYQTSCTGFAERDITMMMLVQEQYGHRVRVTIKPRQISIPVHGV